VPLLPDKTNAPPVINAYTVLALALAFKRLQAVTRRNQQIIQAGRRFQYVKPAHGYPGNSGEAAAVASIKKFLCILATPSLNHSHIVLLFAYYVKRKIANRDFCIILEGSDFLFFILKSTQFR
jgi:hypothetical protein